MIAVIGESRKIGTNREQSLVAKAAAHHRREANQRRTDHEQNCRLTKGRNLHHEMQRARN